MELQREEWSYDTKIGMELSYREEIGESSRIMFCVKEDGMELCYRGRNCGT
jgi:hypothetical protein